MHGPLHRGAGRDLESEATLAGAARPRDRHEASPLLQQAFDTGERVCAADEAVMEGRKARRRQCLQGWELLAQLGRHQLEELCGGPYVLQAMTPERTEGGAGKRLVAGDVADSPRHDDLLAVGGCANT